MMEIGLKFMQFVKVLTVFAIDDLRAFLGYSLRLKEAVSRPKKD